MKRHNGNKLFECAACSKRFTRSSVLNRHMLEVHSKSVSTEPKAIPKDPDKELKSKTTNLVEEKGSSEEKSKEKPSEDINENNEKSSEKTDKTQKVTQNEKPAKSKMPKPTAPTKESEEKKTKAQTKETPTAKTKTRIQPPRSGTKRNRLTATVKNKRRKKSDDSKKGGGESNLNKNKRRKKSDDSKKEGGESTQYEPTATDAAADILTSMMSASSSASQN